MLSAIPPVRLFEHFLFAISLVIVAIGCGDDIAPPPPPPPPPPQTTGPTAPTIPPIGSPAIAGEPTQPGDSGTDTSTNLLSGTYELTWIENARGRQPMPQTLLAQMSGCVWGRWLWNFGTNGNLRVYNELLCEDPQLGTGMCRAEFETRVQWHQQTFVVPTPVTARGLFISLRPRSGSWPTSAGQYNSTTIRCNVNLSNVNARLTEVVPGTAPNRPQSVTLDIGGGERIHLVVTQEEVDYGAIMLRHATPQ